MFGNKAPKVPVLNEAQPGAGEIQRVAPEDVERVKAEVAAQNAANAGQLLRGQRQLGVVPGANGSVTRHYETSDGMKAVRTEGSPYKNATEFHVQAGVATAAELADYEAQHNPQPKQSAFRRFAGKLATKFAGHSH